MNFAEFTRAAHGQRAAILALTTAGALANTLALLLANQLAGTADAAGVWTLLAFATAALVHIVAVRRASHRIHSVVEGTLLDIKRRIVEKVERTDLARLERIGASEIFDRLTENMSVLSLAGGAVGSALQGLSVLVFSLGYIAWLSPAALMVVLPLMLGSFLLYRARVRVAERLLREYNATRVRFLDLLMGLIRGAKEIKLSRARGEAALVDFARASAGMRDASTRFADLFDDSLLFLSCNLYLLLAALVFVVPAYVELDDDLLSALLAAVLFVWGSMQAGLAAYPFYVQAEAATTAISALEQKLDGAREGAAPELAEDVWSADAGPIELAGVEYRYAADDDDAFRVGPIDLTIERGEIVFVVGGNGSGKTTLIKVLTGLYAATRGVLRCGGVRVEPDNTPAYRELITPILSDFHLFSRAYGMLDVTPEAVQPLLRQMQLEHKTAFKQGRFTRRDLSTGQRKRLAMVLALLEDRPIMVFDEWAADQDPEFRMYFYEELLPALRRRGKTVIAVSHDDRYFRCADRVVTMERGVVRSVQDHRQRAET